MLRTNELERVSDNASVILCLHFTFSLPSSFGKSPNDFEMLSTPNIAKRLMSRCVRDRMRRFDCLSMSVEHSPIRCMGKDRTRRFDCFIDVGRVLSYTMHPSLL